MKGGSGEEKGMKFNLGTWRPDIELVNYLLKEVTRAAESQDVNKGNTSGKRCVYVNTRD